MKILVLGGTRFVGRHIVEHLHAQGHLVSVFTRGTSPDELPAGVERIHGDRNNGAAGLDMLVGHSWDACVDVSGYTPRQVRPSAELLCGKVGRYVFISTGSVYADPALVPLLETQPLHPEAAEDVTEVTGETYGPLKVTCERIVTDLFGERGTILRPQIVAGPWDPTRRHTYWVQRAMQAGPMLAPGDGSDPVQVVDARDIARFTSRVIQDGVGGIFNMAGPPLTWRAFIALLGADDVTWVPASVTEAAGLTSAQLPLFVTRGSSYAGIMNMDASRAAAAGFALTDPARTIADTREWLRANPFTAALTPELEREVMARTTASGT
jgi:2'-hydroxyisoflavone reductase